MNTQITPDEHAAMRERYAADLPSAWDTSAAAYGRVLRDLGTSARNDVPRLLDALDTAEAEVARLRGPHPCCEHCAEDPVHDVAPGEHELPCTSCEADTLLGRVRRERDAALAVVREHLPVKPHRDALAAAIRLRHREMGSGVETVTVDDYESADAVLDLFPGRSEVEVKAEAWDKAVDTLSRHWEDVAPAAVADLERRNPYRGSSDCGCDLTGMVPPAVHIVDNHEGGAS